MMPARTCGAVLAALVCALVTAAPGMADPEPSVPAPVPAPAPGPPPAGAGQDATPPSAGAEATIIPVAATQPASEAAPAGDGPVDGGPENDGRVPSGPPQTTTTPDGWTMTVSSKDETQVAAAPLTTAISTREYVVGGVFNGKLDGAGEDPEGVFEVGYQIGCGIDMSTSNGVSLTGTAGINPSIGYFGLDFAGQPGDGLLPGIAGNLAGGITVGLKPGLINVVPVTKKVYKGAAPWVSISNFRVKIDGCVGESFIRSYATLLKSTDEGDAILSWYGTTKAV